MRIKVTSGGGVATAYDDGTKMAQTSAILVRVSPPSGGEHYEVRRGFGPSKLHFGLRASWREGNSVVTRVG